jgi:8-oxo-dGTP pyrophosphatase MutT (NUDIX family)
MLDGDGHFSGVAARELEEETGIAIHRKSFFVAFTHFTPQRIKAHRPY